MRYGENPHQSAAFYGTKGDTGPSIARAKQFQGKELSFNNILDADAALSTVLEFSDIATVAIKHNNPCGVALSKDIPRGFVSQGKGLRSGLDLRRRDRVQPPGR